MKTFSNYLFAVLSIAALWSCETDDKIAGPISFQFEFSSFGGLVEGDMSCGEPPIFLIRQKGEGTDKLLGDFTFVAPCCTYLATGEYFGGPSSFGYFEDENGDHLNVINAGQILPSTKEGYDLMFQNPIEVDGGTGRFEGATGSGMTDSFVNLEEGRTDHVWTGIIILN